MAKFEDRKKKWGSEMVFKSISLPANIIEKLKLLQSSYQKSYGRKVSYGEIFERLLSQMGLGNVDPGAYNYFQEDLKTRSEFNDVIKRSTGKAVDELVDRAQANGTTLKEEALKEQKAVVERMEKQREEWMKDKEEKKRLKKAQKRAVKTKEASETADESEKSAKPAKSPKNKVKADDQELDAWLDAKRMVLQDDNDIDFIIRSSQVRVKAEDSKYASDEPLVRGMKVGNYEDLLMLYIFEEAAESEQDKEKAARLLKTYRRRLDAELQKK